MFRKMKKFVVLIPCMIFAFFLFSGVKAMASNAKLKDSEIITIGDAKKENTYYFTKSSVWEFSTDYSFLNGQILTDEIFLRWRLVNPEGKATEWSDKVGHKKAKGYFAINNYATLTYDQDDDMAAARFSIAPENTYYLDIRYYDQVWGEIHRDKKDETLKIVVNGDPTLMTPIAKISYNKSTNKFSLFSYFAVGGHNIISKVQYLFANDSTLIIDPNTFKSAYINSSITNKYTSIVNSATYTKTIDADDTADMLYLLVTTPHGYEVLVSYDIVNDQGGDSNGNVVDTPDTNGQQNSNENNDKGIFDYDFGQLILIILVVVLVVSCALIITQKIVDYKKRLY